MQYIFIRELNVQTVIGVSERERRRPQTLTFDVEVGIATREAFVSDRIQETIDYARVAELIKAELQVHSFILLERLAGHLCERIAAELEPRGSGCPWPRLESCPMHIVWVSCLSMAVVPPRERTVGC